MKDEKNVKLKSNHEPKHERGRIIVKPTKPGVYYKMGDKVYQVMINRYGRPAGLKRIDGVDIK